MGAVAADLFIATTTTAATIANDIMDAEVGTPPDRNLTDSFYYFMGYSAIDDSSKSAGSVPFARFIEIRWVSPFRYIHDSFKNAR
jgi:hypothetical protein